MNNLFTEFTDLSLEEWQKAFEKSLKGQAVEPYLSTEIIEGIKLSPYINQENSKFQKVLSDIQPADFPYTRGKKYSSNTWNDVAFYDVNDPKAVNKKILKDLEEGFATLEIKADEVDSGQKFFNLLLHDINPNYLRINFKVKSLQSFCRSLEEYYKVKEHDLSTLKGILYNDLFENTLQRGSWKISKNQDTKYFFDVFKLNQNLLSSYKSLLLKTDILHNSGLNIVNQLAFTLSQLAYVIENAEQYDVDKSKLIKKIALSFSVGTNFIPEIAKIKALKYLWVKVLEANNISKTDIQTPYFRANTSLRYLAKKDIYNNIIRGSIQAMSASLAGVDEIYVTPFDANSRKKSALGNRLSINTSRILAEETYFDKVVDPLSGSYYIDTLTHDLIEKAWDKFCEIEEKGGFVKMMESGALAEIVQKDNEKELALINDKKVKMIGVNIHLNAEDKFSNLYEKEEESNFVSKTSFPPIKNTIID